MPCYSRRSLSGLLVWTTLCLLPAPAADAPAWWSTQGVVQPALQRDDYAAANAGQLKNLATKAAAEMDQRLAFVGGAGATIRNLVQSWQSQNPQAMALRDDYAVVTLGQIKNVVSKFHDRIATVKMQPSGVYPWSTPGQPETLVDDFSIANVGQLKEAFAFVIPIVRQVGDGNAGIPETVFAPKLQFWEDLVVKPHGSSLNDLDGDGISNSQEYRMTQVPGSPFSISKALIDPEDLDGDGIRNDMETGVLSSTNFADAVADADGDGLTNYEEIIVLAATYGTQFDNEYSIRDNFIIPDSGDAMLSPACGLKDGQTLRWRRDIARWDYNAGMVGAPGTDIEIFRDNVFPSQAPAEMWVWEDTDSDSMPDGYVAWLGDASNEPAAASSDVDNDALPNLWEHKFRLGVHSPSNSGWEGDKVPLGQEWNPANVSNARIFHYQPHEYPGYPGQEPVYEAWDVWHFVNVWKHLPAMQDPDKDTLPNWREHQLGSNPWLKDTDGDGFDDFDDSVMGSSPTDAESKPPVQMAFIELPQESLSPPSGPLLVLRLWQGPRPVPGRQVELEISAGAGAFQKFGMPSTSGPVSLITDVNGEARIYLRPANLPPGPEDGSITVSASSGSLAASATLAVQRDPEPPLLVAVAVGGGVPTPLREGTTLNLNISLTKGGQPYFPVENMLVNLSATLGTFLPKTGPTLLQATSVTIGSSGQASMSWLAPVFGIGTVQAVLKATIAGSQPHESPPWDATLSVIGSRESPIIGGSTTVTQPPVRTIPASQSPPTLFTSVRMRSGFFYGSDKPALHVHDGYTESMSYEEYVKDAEEGSEPPTQPHDNFDGDLDDDPNDDGDPRDENARTKPYEDEPEEKRTVHADEDDDGARLITRQVGMGWDASLAGTSNGPTSHVSAGYKASNLLHAVPPTKETSQSAALNEGKLNGMINGVNWGHDDDDGWMGDGDYGLRPVSAGSRHSSVQMKETLSWMDGEHEPQSAEVNWKEESAFKTVKQVRLQSSKPVEEEGGMSATFILVKNVYTIPKEGEEPEEPVTTYPGTITLKIPRGQNISKNATATGQAAQYIKTEDGSKVIDLKVDNFQAGKEIVLDLVPVELYSDLNNDGQLTIADAGLVGKPYESGASDEEKAKGTECMFANDQISNGAHDREDTSSDDPSEDDDDAKGIYIKVGFKIGKVSLDHPAIDALTFYKHKSCHPEEKLKLKDADPFDLEGTEQLPDTIYARCDGELNVPYSNPQSLGDLILKYLPKSGGQYIQLAKTKLVVVKEYGAEDFFQTANDYIMENNAKMYSGRKDYDNRPADRVAVTVMRQEATKMKVLDTHNDVPNRLYGIREVVAANPDADVIINGNMTFDTVRYAGEGAVVVNGFNRHRYITKQCHGRLVSGARLLPGFSDNFSSDVFVGGWPGSDLAGINGKYLAMKGKGDFIFVKGRVPVDLSTGTPAAGMTEAMGGLGTNYAMNSEAGFVGSAKLPNEKKMLFTVIDMTPGEGNALDSRIATDAERGGVQKLHLASAPAGAIEAHELELFRTDGASSLALAVRHAGPAGVLKVEVEGTKHTGRWFENYVIHTYLSFTSDRPRGEIL